MRGFASCICLAAWLLGAVVAAQESAATIEPDAAQVSAARRALREEREQERLTLSDAWMKHLDREERESLQLQRWVFGASFGAGAVIWGVIVVARNAENDDSLGVDLALGGAATLSLGLLATQALLSDDFTASSVAHWGMFAELAMAGTAFAVGGSQSCSNSDCKLLMSVLAANTFCQAVATALVELLYPKFYVSKHYRSYLERSAPDRAPYALDLMLERESRQRATSYIFYSMATAQASIYAVTALQAERPGTRGLFAVLAGTTFLTASVNLIVQLLERTPAENLAAGLPPPPAPDAF